MPFLTRTRTFAAVLAAATLTAGHAAGELVAADSFLDGGNAPDTAAGQYDTSGFGGLGSSIRNQDPTIDGFVGPWGGTSNTAIGWFSTGNVLTRASGLDLGYGFEQPGSVNYLNTSEDGIYRFVQRELDTASITPTSTWYMSAIVNPGGDAGGARSGYVYAGFTNDLTDGRLYRDPAEDPGNIGNLFGTVVGFERDDANNELDLVLRHRQDTGGGDVKPASNVLIDGVADQASQAVFLKIDAVAGGPDSITYWVNPDPTATDEAGFDAVNDATGTLASFGFNSDADNWNALDLDFNRAVISTLNWNGSMSVDELRLASTFEDLLGITADGVEGDYDNSGQVEQGDLDFVLQNWGDTDISDVTGWVNFAGLPGGDIDGQVEQTELDLVLSNWGDTSAPDFVGSAVPEPAALGLLTLGVAAARRRSH